MNTAPFATRFARPSGSIGVTSFIRVDITDHEMVKRAVRMHPDRGKVLYLETITNPQCEVVNMTVISALAKANNCILVVDSTWTPPLVQQIFDYDVDVLAYSLTKSHNGHSDVVAGAVVCNR